VEISFASFATIADVVLPAKTRKNSFRPSKKTSQADLYLTSLNDGVFRSNKRYDSEAQGRHVSIDKNKELTGGET
jgi:hypothetical protein